jgi:hypothetical protein
MALRSELYLDSVWAINALNVLLYDDVTGTPPSLSQMPDILGILVKHFAAILSILFPDQFNVSE